MTVKPRGTRHQATVHWKGQRHRKDFATRIEALAWEAETLELVKAGGVPAGSKPASDKIRTFGEMADYVIENHWKVKGQSSAEDAIRNARMLVAHFGADTSLTKINYAAIEALKTVLLKKGAANGTVNRKLATLSKVLVEMQKLELRDKSGQRIIKPVIDFLPETEGRVRTLSPTEEAQLVAAARHKGDVDMADYIELSVDTGMRQGEALKVSTAHGMAGRAVVLDGRITKSHKGRTIPMTDRVAAIWARRAAAGELGGRLFPGLTKAAIRHRWATLLELCEITDGTLVPHCMRHTFCSRLADLGAEATDIQRLAGHSTLAMSQKYIHLSARRLASTIALLNPAQTPHATPPATEASVARDEETQNADNVLRFFKKTA